MILICQIALGLSFGLKRQIILLMNNGRRVLIAVKKILGMRLGLVMIAGLQVMQSLSATVMKQVLACISFLRSRHLNLRKEKISAELKGGKNVKSCYQYSMIECVALDGLGVKLDWPEFDYDHTSRDWAE